MTDAVCSDLVLRAATMYTAISVYHIVIAYAAEASLPMPAVYLLYGEVLALGRGRAMYDNLIDTSHGFFFVLVNHSVSL